MRTLLGMAVALVLHASAPAGALPLTVTFTGTVQALDPPLPFLQGEIGSGSFQIESTTSDDTPGSGAGTYHSPVNFSITIGGYTATSAGGTSADFVLINDVTPPAYGADIYTAEAYNVSGATLLDYYFPTRLTFILNDQTATAFASDALPASLDLADFSYGAASIRFEGPGMGDLANVTLLLTSVSVPEPAAGLLLVLAVIGRRASQRGRSR
jgi:hypothetical protein